MIPKKYDANVTIIFLIALLLGFILAIVIIQPLAISIFMYNNQGGFIGWWNTFKTVFQEIIKLCDSEQILKNFLFGIMGICITLMYYIGLNMRKKSE